MGAGLGVGAAITAGGVGGMGAAMGVCHASRAIAAGGTGGMGVGHASWSMSGLGVGAKAAIGLGEA